MYITQNDLKLYVRRDIKNLCALIRGISEVINVYGFFWGVKRPRRDIDHHFQLATSLRMKWPINILLLFIFVT